MVDGARDSTGTPSDQSRPVTAHTDSHTEVQSEAAYMPLVYLTFGDWRTTIPRASLETMTLEQQYESYQRLISLLTRLSAKEMPEGNPIAFPNYAIVPSSGRPLDVIRATADFVESQNARHDLRLAECQLERLQQDVSTDPEEVAAVQTRIKRLGEFVDDGDAHFEREGLKHTVAFKEFIVMKEWKEALGSALRSGTLLRSFSSQKEMRDVLKRVEKSITERESQLVEGGILPLVQAPQTAKRLAANILITSTSGTRSTETKDQRNGPGRASPPTHPTKKLRQSPGSAESRDRRCHASPPGTQLVSPSRSSHTPGRHLEEAESNPQPPKKRRTE